MFTNDEESVRQKDFDFVIVLDGHLQPALEGNASVLHFEAEEAEPQVAVMGLEVHHLSVGPKVVPVNTIYRIPGKRAFNFAPYDSLPREDPSFFGIVNETIAANIHRPSDYTVVEIDRQFRVKTFPLFAELDGGSIAAIIFFDDYKPFWSLPKQATNTLRWVRFFIETNKVRSPELFPAEPLGASDRWRTKAELEALAAIEEHEAETQRIMAECEARREELEKLVVIATDAADSGERQLLTTKSEQLVQRVAATLRSIGFQVEDRDEVTGLQKANKQEDLRITSPADDENWVGLVEVKGYAKNGAKASDLGQIRKASGVYIGQTGKDPSAQWYVVNALYQQPVDDRPEPLASNDEEVKDFAQEGGLVIDTRELFLLLKSMDQGQITADEARQDLMKATGRFKAPTLLPEA